MNSRLPVIAITLGIQWLGPEIIVQTCKTGIFLYSLVVGDRRF
jgi:hypothetical protein